MDNESNTPNQIITPSNLDNSPENKPFTINQENKPKKSKKIKLLIASVLVIAVAGASAAAFLTMKKEDKPELVKKDIPVLKYALQSDGLNIDLPIANIDLDTTGLLYQTHEGLVSWDNETNFAPAIAKSWSSPNSTTWEFVIESNRLFNTGAKITPEAIKASIDAYIALDPQLPAIQTIDKVEAVGNDKIKITTKTPDAILLNRLAILFIYDTKYEKGKAWQSGSGAYTLKDSSTLDNDNLALSAVDSHPKGRPYVREIQVTNLSTIKDAKEELNKGTFDLQTDGPTSEAESKKISNYTLNLKKASGAYSLRLNNRDGKILSNKKVRQAIAYGLDMQKVIDADSGLAGTRASQIVSDLIPGFNPAIKAIDADVDKAKSLLTEAGYKNEPIKVGYFAGRQDKPMIEIINQLKAIGINVETETKDNGGDFVEAIMNNAYDIVSASSLTNYGDLSDIASDVGGKNSYVPNYYNPEVDEALDKASTVFEPQERLVELQKISKLIADDYGVIPIRYSLYPTYHRNTIVIGDNDFPSESFGIYFYNIYGK